MQKNKAKYHLKRIQTILDLHDGNISKLDRDILLGDIRQLYDLVLEVEEMHPGLNVETPRDNTYVAPVNIPASAEPVDYISQNEQTDESSITSLNEPEVKVDTDVNVQSRDVNQQVEQVHTPTTVTYETTPVNKDEHINITPEKRSSDNEKMNGKTEESTPNSTQSEEYHEVFVQEKESYLELFDFPTTSELSDRLASSKIEQLNKILTINDKILYINHLFNGEAIPFQENLKIFENFYTYEEAKKYAAEELVVNFNWTESEKYDIVRQFMRQVKRLY